MKHSPAFASPSLNIARMVPFWRMLLMALGFMALSGVLVISGFLAYHLKEFNGAEVQPLTWLGKGLQLIEGRGLKIGEELEIRSLSRRGQAIISSGRVAITAEKYPFLEYDLQGLQEEMNPVFFWRRKGEPEKLLSLSLNGQAVRPRLLRLAYHGAWQGTIIEFGLGFRKVLPEPVVIKTFVFKPASIATLLTSLWSDWTTFKGWSQRSINFIEGNGSNELIPPVLAAAVWVGLALLLYGVWGFFQSWQWDWRVVSMVFLLGWVAIDARWQVGLWRQLQATYDRYADQRWNEKHLAGEDAPLFKFITEVKAKLPQTPQRIFLVTAKSLEADHYTRLRARYHLLPHNVHDYGTRLPSQNHAQAGDYVLILETRSEFTSDAEKQLLQEREEKKNGRGAKQIYTDSMGTLYLVD